MDGNVDIEGHAKLVLTPTSKVTIFHGSGNFSPNGTGLVNMSQIQWHFSLRPSTGGAFLPTADRPTFRPERRVSRAATPMDGGFISRCMTKL